MGTTEIVTIIPSKLAKDFGEHKKIENFHNMPQIPMIVMGWIKEFMENNVGYANLPMAGISGLHSSDSEDILHVIPGKPDESILLQLEVPEDMIVPVAYSKLLDYAEKVNAAGTNNSVALEILHDQFLEELECGDVDDSGEVISFIPFLDFNKCTCYALLNENFQIGDFKIDGLPQKSLNQIASFYQ